jgi:molybdate transport system substrate-binding protein
VRACLLMLTLCASSLMSEVSYAAEIKAFFTGAARRSLAELVPQFERATGHKVAGEYALPPDLIKRIDAGEPFDVIILSYDVEALVARGKVTADSRTVLGRIGVGVAVCRGAPKPEFSTVEAFKRTLLNAKAIGTSGEGSSGRYVAGLIERLGIAEAVRPKIRSGGAGASVQLLSRGEVDFVVSGLPPLIGASDIEWLGYLPAEINQWLLFTGGVGANAKEAQAAHALLKFLTTQGAVAVWKDNGLEPVR